jgi:cobaltochelatase CobS
VIKKIVWEDIDKIVQMKTNEDSPKPVSLSKLEVALAEKDEASIRLLVESLRRATDDYVCVLYPFGGIKLASDIQISRIKKWFNEGTLVGSLYAQCRAKKKEIKTLEEIDEETEEEVEVEGKSEEEADIDEVIDKTKHSISQDKQKKRGRKGKQKKSSASKPLMKIKEKIKFDQLQKNDALSAYIPATDKNYVFPAWTLEFVKMLDHGINVWLYGGTGAGKSSLVEQVCAAGELPLMYQSFHEDIKPDQLFGGKDLVDGNTVWVDGPVTKSYREGFVLLLDEIDALPPEIQFCLYGVLDGKPLVLAENNNEVVYPHENFRVIATGNTHGRGDESGMFGGTNILNRAFLNRFRVWYQVDYPQEDIYRNIIEQEGITPKVATIVARLAHEINNGFKEDTLTETFSLRDAREVAKVAELLDGDVGRSLQLTLLNRLSEPERFAVMDMFRRHIPDDM